MENYGACIEDSKKSIEIDKNYAKGYYRLGSAQLGLGKYKEALKSFKLVVKLYPTNKEARDKLTNCDKIVKRIAFEDAISFNEVPISESIDLTTIDVDTDYKGPRLENEITIEFIKELINHLKEQQKLHIKYVYTILLQVKKILEKLPTLLEIEVTKNNTFNVCGDTHGQFYDLLNIFQINGLPSNNNPYLFNGDFVDRGSFSFEVVILLFSLKLLLPNDMHLLRGNHETINMNNIYGFRNEVEAKYNKKVFELFTEVFNYLPLSAVINKKVFVVHGGLFSKDGVTLQDIKNVNRVRQPPDEGLFCEMLWSDPQPFNGRSPNKRGVAIGFGPDVTEQFLKDNSLELVIRSHEVKEEGYLIEHNGKLITVFSAPNYCDTTGNKGAIVKLNFDDGNVKTTFVQFKEVPHPNIKPMAYSSSFSNFL